MNNEALKILFDCCVKIQEQCLSQFKTSSYGNDFKFSIGPSLLFNENNNIEEFLRIKWGINLFLTVTEDKNKAAATLNKLLTSSKEILITTTEEILASYFSIAETEFLILHCSNNKIMIAKDMTSVSQHLEKVLVFKQSREEKSHAEFPESKSPVESQQPNDNEVDLKTEKESGELPIFRLEG